MATIDRTKLFEDLAKHVPEFEPLMTYAVQIHPTYLVVDVASSLAPGDPCWKPGCTDRARNSLP